MTTPGTLVRPLRPDDHDTWEQLFRGYTAFYERDDPQSMYDRLWDGLLAGERFHGLGAEVDGRLVGLVHYLFHANTTSRDVCYLEDLFVAPDARGRGAGRALIEAVADVARERRCDRVYWLTQTSNTTARRLYDQVAEDRGFMVYRMPLRPRD